MSPQVQPPASRPRRHGLIESALRIVAAAGLGVDAYVHLALAGDYDANRGALISQGDLFRIEAAAAIAAALLVVLVRRRGTDVLVLVVAASAGAAALVYRFIDLGPVFWMPDMYEPAWFPLKTLATVAEIVAALAALVLVAGRARLDVPTRA